MQELVNCTSNRTFSVYYGCQTEKKVLCECLSQYTTPHIYDSYIEDALNEKLDRINRLNK